MHASFVCYVSVNATMSYFLINSVKDGSNVFCPIIPLILKIQYSNNLTET